MKKVLIIEDEYQEVRIAFEYVNEMYFSSELDYMVVAKSQEISFCEIENYDFIFVDIKLAKRTNLDGYGILREIEKNYPNVKRLIVLTGNNKIKETMKERGIKKEYQVITKPIDINDLREVFKE